MAIWLKRLAVGLVAIALLALVAGWLMLRSESAQRSLLGKLSAAIESATGMTLEAETVELRVGAGAVDLGGVRLLNGSGEEVATVARVRAAVRWGPLLRGRVEIRSVVLESPGFDPSRLPEGEAEVEPAEPAGPPSIQIRNLRIVDGSVASIALGGGAEPPTLSFSGLDLEGALVDGVVTVDLEGGEARLERPGASPVTARLGGRLEGPWSGPLELSAVTVVGDALDLVLAGALGLAESQPTRFTLAGSLDAGRLLDAPESALVSVDGEIDLGSRDGRLALAGSAIPAELVRPWIGDEAFERLDGSGTTLGIEGDLRFGPGNLGRVAGSVDAGWRRGEDVLMSVDLTPEILGDARSLELPFDLRLAPAMAGTRQVGGVVSIADWAEPMAGEIIDGRLDLELPDLRAAGTSLRQLWPTASEAVPSAPAGALTLAGSIAGPLSSPAVDIEGDWLPATGGSLTASIDGAPLERSGRLALRAESFPIAALGLGWSGLLDGDLELAGGPGGRSAVFDLSVDELTGGDIEAVSAATRGDWNGETLALTRLRIDGMGHELDAAVSLGLTSEGLRAEAGPLTLDGVTLALTADLPGSMLGEVPVIGARSWTTPFARGRRLRVGWRLAEADLSGALGLGSNRLELASSGEALVDLDRLAASSVEATISTLSWVDPRADFQLERPMELRLDDGRLTARELRLASASSRLAADLEVDLVRDWEPSDGFDALIATAEIEATGVVGDDWLGEALGSIGEPLSFSVELGADRERFAGWMRADGAGSWVEAEGRLSRHEDAQAAFDVKAEGALQAAAIAAVAGLGAADGVVSFDLALAREGDAQRGRVRLDGDASTWAIGAVTLGGPALQLEIADGRLTLHDMTAVVDGQPVAANASARIEPGDEVGTLEIERLELLFAGIDSLWAGTVPIKTGDAWPQGSHVLALEWRIDESDLAPVMTLLGALESTDTLRAGSSGNLRIPIDTPWLTRGEVEIDGFTWGSGGRQATSEGPIRLLVGDARATLLPARIVSSEQLFEFEGRADLATDWSPDLGPAALIRELDVRGDGVLLASLMNPFLNGGIAEGELRLDITLSGPPDALRGRLSARGSDTGVTYARPYLTRISEPDLEWSFEPGESARLSGTLKLNEGSVRLATDATEEGRTRFRAELDGVRYRLDHGLLALLDGELTLASEADESWTIAGVVEVENGVLTRNVDLDLDFLLGLLAPVDLTSTEDSPLEAFALDLELRTVEGVRIRNNAADLWVRWDPVRIGGTLAGPVFDGRFDVEPGGRVYAFGQTVRIDRASLDYPGVADLPATLDLKVTSSIEDPTIAGLAADDPFASERDQAGEEVDRVQAVASGLGSFYGERLASRLTAGAGGAKISIQPTSLLIFGEANPGARLTVSQDFSPQVTVAASADLRSAEARTYLLDVHAIEAVPGLNAQVFTTDTESQGLALRQRRLLGPGRVESETGPRARSIDYQLPAQVSKRRVKRALGIKKGDRLGPGERFAAEVEVTEELRARGYPDARVSVAALPTGDGVDLSVAVRPGPHARFEFRGVRMPKALKRRVVDLYRADYWEQQALVEMEAEARRALRSLGYLEPQVDVSVVAVDAANGGGDRRVTVESVGGQRVELESVRFLPLPPDESALLASRFSQPVRRVELAAGVPEADRRVEQTLRYLGYAGPRVVERRIVEGRKELEVVVETGERPRLRMIEVVSSEPELDEDLRRLIEITPGEPLRPDRIAGASLRIQEELRSRGYADAHVVSRIESDGSDPARTADLRFDVDPGTSYFIGEVAFSGLRSTRPKLADRVAELELEADFSEDEVYEARRRLWRTGLFHSVTPEIVRAPGGVVRVDFEVQERQRFEVAYGLRWDSVDELATLAEAIDRNVLGRGWTAGLRAQWAEDDQSLRAFAGLPRLFGPRTSVGLFASVREQTEGNLFTETLEGTTQLSWQLAERLTARLYGQVTESRVSEVVPDPFALVPFDVRLFRPVLGSQLLFDSRYGESLSRRGLLATLDFSISHGSFGSDFDYVRFFGQVDYLRRLPGASKRFTWAQSLRIGLAEAFAQEVVRLDRFFAGGEFSVRGYRTESLGPQETLGLTMRARGGDALLVINEELRWRFADRYSLIAFVDAGNVWVDLSDFGSGLSSGVGLGLRALTPVGLLRLDLARALDRRDFDPSYKLYFGFGSTF